MTSLIVDDVKIHEEGAIGNRVSTRLYILGSIKVLASVRSRVGVTMGADPILAKALSPPWIGDLSRPTGPQAVSGKGKAFRTRGLYRVAR